MHFDFSHAVGVMTGLKVGAQRWWIFVNSWSPSIGWIMKPGCKL